MRRLVGAVGLAAALVLTTRAGLADPETALIDFENAPAGPITEAFSADWLHGPFAIDGMTAAGNGQAIVVPDPSGYGQVLTLDNVLHCGCAMLHIDLHGASGELALVESFRIVGTMKPARIVYIDSGGNSWPNEEGQWVPATGMDGSTVVVPEDEHAAAVAEMYVFFQGCGALDDLRLVRNADHDPPPPPEPPAPPPPPTSCLESITLEFGAHCGDVVVTTLEGDTLLDLGEIGAGDSITIVRPEGEDDLPDVVHFVVTHHGAELESFDLVLTPNPEVGSVHGSFTVTSLTSMDAGEEPIKKAKKPKGKKPKKPKKPGKKKHK